MVQQLQVNCPRCQSAVMWSPESPFRPFCSERCKLMDLGAWATEKYRVPDPHPDTAEEGHSPLPDQDAG